MIPEGAIARLVQAMQFVLVDSSGRPRGVWQEIAGHWSFLPFDGVAISTLYPPIGAFPDDWQPYATPPTGINWIQGQYAGSGVALRALILVGPPGTTGPDPGHDGERIATMALGEQDNGVSTALLFAGSDTPPGASIRQRPYSTIGVQASDAVANVHLLSLSANGVGRGAVDVYATSVQAYVASTIGPPAGWLDLKDDRVEAVNLAVIVPDATAGGHALNRNSGDARYLLLTGGELSGLLRAPNFYSTSGQSRLFSGTASAPVILANTLGTNCYVGVYPDATDPDVLGARAGYFGLASGHMQLAAEGARDVRITAQGDVRITAQGGEQGRFIAGGLLIGKTGTAVGTPGTLLGGSILWTTTDDATLSASPYLSNIVAAANVNGKFHFRFLHAGALVGSVTRATATTIAFNTSSDAQLKDVLGPVDPEVAAYVLDLLDPTWFTWLADPDAGIVSGYIAQAVAEAWPEAIAHGVVTPGHGTPDDDDFQPWQMDVAKLVPVLHAAWRYLRRRQIDTDRRLDALEARQDPPDPVGCPA